MLDATVPYPLRDSEPGSDVWSSRAARSYDSRLSPARLALTAARMLLQQDLWGRVTISGRVLGWLTLVDSLRLAAGGIYGEDGRPQVPSEPAAAQVLTTTCELLAGALQPHDGHYATSAVNRLGQVSQDSTEDSIQLQHLLATVHGRQNSIQTVSPESSG